MLYFVAMKAIDKAIAILGGPTAFARRIGVSKQFVTQLQNGKRSVPAKRCLPIQAATKDGVTVHELRPDVFGPAPKKRRAA